MVPYQAIEDAFFAAGLADLSEGGVYFNFHKPGEWDIYIPIGRNTHGQIVIYNPIACPNGHCLGISTFSCANGQNIETCRCFNRECSNCTTGGRDYEIDNPNGPRVGGHVTDILDGRRKQICSVNRVGGTIVSIEIS